MLEIDLSSFSSARYQEEIIPLGLKGFATIAFTVEGVSTASYEKDTRSAFSEKSENALNSALRCRFRSKNLKKVQLVFAPRMI